jgi:D-alanyl-D-alanine carboxypeptidase (penicillin-binding protein 5/6)
MVLAGLSTFNGRISESVRFMDWGFKAWKAQPLFRKGQEIEKAPIQMGSDNEVGLVAPKNLAVTLPRTASSNMTVKLVYNGPIMAPIKKGQKIAELVVSTPDTDPQIMPLVAANDVEKAGFFGRLWNGLMSLFG